MGIVYNSWGYKSQNGTIWCDIVPKWIKTVKFDTMKVRLPKGAKTKISSSEDIHAIMYAVLMRQTKLRRKKEYFWVIGLNPSSDLLFVELISMGSLTQTMADPLDVFWLATNKKCHRLILAHNHTGTGVEPSGADRRITMRLQAAGTILGIEIEDHIILCEEKKKYFSFKDKKLL